MRKKSICIDITNVVPGKGGTGGGIVTYAINLVKHLDQYLNKDGIEVYCLKNSMFKDFENLSNIKLINISINNSNIFSRLLWLHVRLPLFCLSKKISLLHRIVPELPLVKVCKYLFTMHDFMFDLYLNKQHLRKYLSKGNLLKFYLLKALSHLAVINCDIIIVPSETVKNELKNKYNLIHKKVAVINEASENFSYELNKVNEDHLIIKIGVVAGFYPHKGHFKVLNLAKCFLKLGFNNFKISFRGSHVYKNYVEDIKKEIIRLDLEKFITFEPYKSKISLNEIYSNYDLILLLSEYEGFGLPALEAQTHSKVVLCSNIPIFKEILKESAFFLQLDFAEDDVLPLINKLLDKNEMRKAAIDSTNNAKRFSWNHMIKETLSLYKI